MGICPVCNGFQELKLTCPACRETLEDKGRIMDFYDDYSPYMSIDQLKLEDGYKDDGLKEQCPHLVKCPHCGYEVAFLVKE